MMGRRQHYASNLLVWRRHWVASIKGFPADRLHDDTRPQSRAGTESRDKLKAVWKGTASCYTLNVNGGRNVNAAWYYPEPKDAAGQIKGRVAFWKGISVG